MRSANLPPPLQQPLPRKLPRLHSLLTELSHLQQQLPPAYQPLLCDPKIAEELGNIHYLDAEQSICLVSQTYLKLLASQLATLETAHQEMIKKQQSHLIQIQTLTHDTKLKQQKIWQLTDALSQSHKTNLKFQQQLRKYNKVTFQNSDKLRQIFLKQRVIHVVTGPPEIITHQKISYSTQTQYYSPKLEINVGRQMSQMKDKEVVSEVTERLRELVREYQGQLEMLVKVLGEKFEGVNHDYMDVKLWMERNRVLREQNERLREQMRGFELEKQKAKIWHQQVQSKLKTLEDEVCSQLPLPMVSQITIHQPTTSNSPHDDIQLKVENQYLREEVRNLRQQLIDKQLQMSMMVKGGSGANVNSKVVDKVRKELLMQEEEVADTGLVGRVLGLSMKFRTLTQFLYDVL